MPPHFREWTAEYQRINHYSMSWVPVGDVMEGFPSTRYIFTYAVFRSE